MNDCPLAQANSLLGSRAKLTTDPKNGNYLEVKMMVGDVELSGFVGTKSARINGVHLAYLHEPRLQDVSQEMFKRLKHILTAKYGPPSVKSPEGRIWFWGFTSGNVALSTGRPGETGSAILSYTENEFNPRTVQHD